MMKRKIKADRVILLCSKCEEQCLTVDELRDHERACLKTKYWEERAIFKKN